MGASSENQSLLDIPNNNGKGGDSTANAASSRGYSSTSSEEEGNSNNDGAQQEMMSSHHLQLEERTSSMSHDRASSSFSSSKKTMSILLAGSIAVSAFIHHRSGYGGDPAKEPTTIQLLTSPPKDDHSSYHDHKSTNTFSPHYDNAVDQRLTFDGDDDSFYSILTNYEPLSTKSPEELGFPIFNGRPEFSRPGSVFGKVRDGARIGRPLPTNEWYLNLVVGLDDTPSSEPNNNNNTHDPYENYASDANRVHTIPYIIDTVGPIVGIRLHYPGVLSYGTVVQSVFVDFHGVTLGTVTEGFTRRYGVDEDTLPNKLGIGLRWEHLEETRLSMRTSMLRGMPYGTMEYAPGVVPTIASQTMAGRPPLVDGSTMLQCGKLDPHSPNILTHSKSVLVEHDVELYFSESDLTWLVFFSRPVRVRCYVNEDKLVQAISVPPGGNGDLGPKAYSNPNAFQLRVVEDPPAEYDVDGNIIVADVHDRLIVRLALANNCTTGTNVNFCHKKRPRDQSDFASVLREHAHVYPTSPSVKYAFSNPEGGLMPESPDGKSAYLLFDWAARSYNDNSLGSEKVEEKEQSAVSEELIMFALPHQVDVLRGMDGRSSNEVLGHCVHSLHGNACLVKGGVWAMEEEFDGLPSFVAPRPPSHDSIPALAEALSKDINYTLPDNYMRGGGDTYFIGKMLSKLGRIIVIAQELRGLASTPDNEIPDGSTPDEQELRRIISKCKEVTLPSEEDVMSAIDHLRRGVEVWLNGDAEAQFTFDNTWGGLVNCGCNWNGDGCSNVVPDCPAYADPGLNFGNGFYNDHHFHYGYHIYAAAIVAEYDREWGRKYFEHVLLMIRDVANPSAEDKYFPLFRQKDWYMGNSWASGFALAGNRPYSNGRNQESSSEAISAYEGISMYGSVMMKAFGNGKSENQYDNKNAYTACRIFNIGRFLAATEISSADRYWHVYSPKRDQTYPDSYTPYVVGMMWETMAQFQTWFGSAAYLTYGIQLLPITPISERRDSDQWLRQLYQSFEESCASEDNCINEGWAVLLYCVLAELGHPKMAMQKALDMPEDAFVSAGGNGHSLTNTLWYISTRPTPGVPYDIKDPSTSIHSKAVTKTDKERKIDCGCPDTCNSKELKSIADGVTCKERILWLIANKGLSELGACSLVGGNDYKSECGMCDPAMCGAGLDTVTEDKEELGSGCPPCDAIVCTSEINRCPLATAPFLCFEGPARGGCSATAWGNENGQCAACCEIFMGCEG